VRRTLLAAALSLLLAGCLSPAQSLMLALIPDGTFSTLLSNMQGVQDVNRQRLSELAAQEDWAGVVQFAEKNLAVDPTIADWWIVAGYAHTRLAQYERANRAFAEAVRLEPDEMNAWHLLAESYRAMGQPGRALRTLDNAMRVSRDDPNTYFLLGQNFDDLKRIDRAVPHYEQAVQRNPQFVEAWYALGRDYLRLGRRADYENAVAALRELNPRAADHLATLGAEK